MSFHPNEIARRSRAASIIATALIFVLCSAFFRTQILGHKQWVLQSEENRLREVPIAAPRGTIFDRNGKIIAENVVGYSVSVLTQSEDSLRATQSMFGLEGGVSTMSRSVLRASPSNSFFAAHSTRNLTSVFGIDTFGLYMLMWSAL